MNGRIDRFIAWAGALVLIVLHLDFWRGPRTDIYFGFVPEEIAYRVAWMVAALVYMWFFTARIWRDE